MVLHLKVWESRSPPGLRNSEDSVVTKAMAGQGTITSLKKEDNLHFLLTISRDCAHNKSAQTCIKQAPNSNSAGWSSPVARQAHNLKVAGSNPAPATNK